MSQPERLYAYEHPLHGWTEGNERIIENARTNGWATEEYVPASRLEQVVKERDLWKDHGAIWEKRAEEAEAALASYRAAGEQ